MLPHFNAPLAHFIAPFERRYRLTPAQLLAARTGDEVQTKIVTIFTLHQFVTAGVN